MPTMMPIESALIVFVPEADPLVKAFRDQHDPSAAAGCAAHITLLYPFKPPSRIGAADLDVLRQFFARFAPMHFSLAVARRFPGVLYLAPEPDEPFRRLTLAIWELNPDAPPYGGRHSDIVPHLCVARIADEHRLDSIADEFAEASQGKLPIRASASDVALIDTRSGRWQVRATFGLVHG